MITSSAKNTRCIIETPSVVADAVGQRVITWTALPARWGRLIQNSGREVEGSSVLAVSTWELTIDYSSDVASMDPSWRITAAGKTFDIQSVDNVRQKNRHMVIRMQEVA